MPEVFSLNAIPTVPESLFALSRQFLPQRQQEFLIELHDGPLILPGKRLMFNIFLWRPLLLRSLPIEKRHTTIEGLFTKEVIAKIQTEIYTDVVATFGGSDQIKRDVLYDLCEVVDNLHMMVASQLGEYHVSMSIYDLAKLMRQPKIKDLTRLDISQELKISISAAEEKRQKAGAALTEKLLDPTIPGNTIAPFLQLGQLNPVQLTMVLLSAGFRKDAADTIIRRPILEPFINGLNDIRSFAAESLTAKQTIYYNRNAMPNTQYNNRMQQILTSTVRMLHPGDCGTPLTVPFFVHPSNAKHVLSKNIVCDDGLVTLTRKNIANYTNKTVQLRSPLVCRYTDGTCMACGGGITDFMLQHSVIGIVSAQELISQVSQLVLSAKHFTQTKAITYRVPEQLQDYLVVRNDDIYIRDNVDTSNWKIGVSFGDMPHIAELQQMDGDSAIHEQQFSTINYLRFATEDDVLLTGEVWMSADGSAGGSIPYFSGEFLTYVKDNFKAVNVGDVIWIPLKKFDHVGEPLLRCVIESNSMVKFNEKVKQFTSKDIRSYTSLTEILRDFTDIIYREVSTNILYIEIVLKAYLIGSEIDYNIPVVTDPENVKFADLSTIISHRSLGAQFAFEDLKGFLADPSTYTLPHRDGVFDAFFYPLH